MSRWPNYCPFCGTRSRAGGTGRRHTSFICGVCHADYHVEYYGAYPSDRQAECDTRFVEHGGQLENAPHARELKAESRFRNRPENG